MLEKIKQWLISYPQWDDTLYVDYTPAVPGSTGVFPRGVQELSRRQDVAGNVQTRNRVRFTVLRITPGQLDKEKQAAWLLDFQDWVQQQSISGKAPTFGDVPEKEKLMARQGMLKGISQTGTARYAVELIAEYTKIYEA